MKRLQIFRAGKHTADNGASINFTEALLKAAAEAYDPKLHEAPIVIGHPKGSAPAYGWVGKLSFAEGALDVEPIQVDPAFAELVKAGRFKKVSASFYEPDAENNPKPGVYYLRHVGFLGAQPPAVKGLKAAEFAEGEKGVVEFADGWTYSLIARILRRIREAWISEKGVEKADELLPSWEIEQIEQAAAQESAKNVSMAPSFSEQEHGMKPEELQQREQDLKAREEKLTAGEVSFAERTRKLTDQEVAARRRTYLEFVERLVKAGRWLPIHKDGLVAFMSALPEGGTIEFGEGDKKQTPATVAWLQGALEALPKVVDFKERAHVHGVAEQLDTGDPKEISKRALEFKETEAKAGRIISVTEAVAHVTQGAKA